VLLELHFLITSDGVKCLSILNSKFQHVICRVPWSCNIPRHHLRLQLKFIKNSIPAREDNGRGVFDGICDLAELGA
jgi:hypothetical protein